MEYTFKVIYRKPVYEEHQATVTAESEDDAIDMVYDEDWDDLEYIGPVTDEIESKVISKVEKTNEVEPKPICEIINGHYSWYFRADGSTTYFNGNENVIAQLFTRLGYEIK